MKFNKELKDKIEILLNEIKNTHIYKSSMIYSLYNEAYDRNDKSSTCGSCLRTRTQLLHNWLDTYNNNQVINQEEMKEEEIVIQEEQVINKLKRKTKSKE